MKKCHGIHRTTRGHRMLVELTTNPGSPLALAFLAEVREKSPIFQTWTDGALTDEMIKLIARIPAKCPECGAEPS